MPAADSPAVIVARFLKANNYNDTLNAFIAEARLPPDAGTTASGDLTVEKILEEKKVFDLSLNIEKLGVGGKDIAWSPSAPTSPVHITTLPTSANLLHVSVESTNEQTGSQILVATTADRRMTLLRPGASLSLHKSYLYVHDSPILSCVTINTDPWVTVSSSMSGQVVLYDHEKNEALEERRDHSKYVVKVVAYRVGNGVHWVATAGWDGKILVYVLHRRQDSSLPALGPPVAVVSLPTNPESVVFLDDVEDPAPILVATRRDSTSLHYYSLHSVDTAHCPASPIKLEVLGSQNLAPHSNAWIAFSPSSVAMSPTDPSLMAVATSSVPHMKLIIVRLLLPSSGTCPKDPTSAPTQAAQSRENLARQDREDAAIRVNVSTMAPQTAYSTPQVCWRPDGSGVWVNGDDGALRGIEATTGKIVATLKEGGHETGSKIRSIWAGLVHLEGVEGDTEEEWVVSGGFDRRLIAWRPGKNSTVGASP